MEKQIGEEFTLSDGIKLKVIESSHCTDCYFFKQCIAHINFKDIDDLTDIVGYCRYIFRTDNKDIIFVKVETDSELEYKRKLNDASPELLEALIVCCQALKDYLQPCQYKNDVIMFDALKQAEKIIKKVTD